MYMYLVKSNPLLCSFLTKGASRTKPLAKTLMFERIAAARDAKYKELLLVEAGLQPPPAALAAEATSIRRMTCKSTRSRRMRLRARRRRRRGSPRRHALS